MKWSIANKIASVLCLVSTHLVIAAVFRDSLAKLIDSRPAIGAGWPTPPNKRHGA